MDVLRQDRQKLRGSILATEQICYADILGQQDPAAVVPFCRGFIDVSELNRSRQDFCLYRKLLIVRDGKGVAFNIT